MPTYQYQCKNCGHQLEEFQSITEAPLVNCPQCKMDTLARVLGGGGGLIFKGSGFYLTDYARNNKSDKTEVKKEGEKPATPSTPKTSESSSPSAPASPTSEK